MQLTSDYSSRDYWFVQPEGFAAKVNIRKTITKTGSVRYHYYSRSLRWLPIAADKAIAAIAQDW